MATLTNAQGAAISGGVDGILTFGEPSTVVNQGAIDGSNNIGVALVAGGLLSNAATGTIYGGYAGVKSGGTDSLTLINAAGGTIAGGRYGVYAGAGNVSNLTNGGIMIGYSAVGALVLGGGTVDNQTHGRISGYYDAIVANGTAASTITNAAVFTAITTSAPG